MKKSKLLKLSLKKSLTEPWPYEYGGRSKWDPDRLIRWKVIDGNGSIQRKNGNFLLIAISFKKQLVHFLLISLFYF